MRLLGVFPGVLHYSKIFLRLEPIGLELVAQADGQLNLLGMVGQLDREGPLSGSRIQPTAPPAIMHPTG